MININIPESIQPSQEDLLEARRIEQDPAAMLRLIDLIFGPSSYLDNIPS